MLVLCTPCTFTLSRPLSIYMFPFSNTFMYLNLGIFLILYLLHTCTKFICTLLKRLVVKNESPMEGNTFRFIYYVKNFYKCLFNSTQWNQLIKKLNTGCWNLGKGSLDMQEYWKRNSQFFHKFAGAFIFIPELHVAQMLPSLTKWNSHQTET